MVFRFTGSGCALLDDDDIQWREAVETDAGIGGCVCTCVADQDAVARAERERQVDRALFVKNIRAVAAWSGQHAGAHRIVVARGFELIADRFADHACFGNHAAARLCHDLDRFAKARCDHFHDAGCVKCRCINRLAIECRETAADVEQGQCVACVVCRDPDCVDCIQRWCPHFCFACLRADMEREANRCQAKGFGVAQKAQCCVAVAAEFARKWPCAHAMSDARLTVFPKEMSDGAAPSFRQSAISPLDAASK